MMCRGLCMCSHVCGSLDDANVKHERTVIEINIFVMWDVYSRIFFDMLGNSVLR